MGRIAPNGTPVVVQTGASVIVVNPAGEILMQQRRDDGTWSYPGGRIEIDETVEDAARREVWEESGLTVGSLELLGVFSGPELNHVYPNGNEVCGIDIVYVSRDFSGTLRCTDGEAVPFCHGLCRMTPCSGAAERPNGRANPPLLRR